MGRRLVQSEVRLCLGQRFSSPGRYVFRGRCDASHKMQVVAVAVPAIARSVGQGSHNGDTEPTDRALFGGSVKIGLGVNEWIKGRPVVDEIDRQHAAPATKCHDDTACRKLPPVAVGNNVGEKLFEDDEEPPPFVIGEATVASKCLGKGLEPNKLGSLAS